MALRSVVLAPPPGAGGPRRTVVLRPGGPKDKGKAADVITGIVGVMLLLACVFLAQWLPDKEYALPQFQVTFPEAQLNNTSQRFDFTEQARDHEFTYELPDNAFSVTLVLFYIDDLCSSLPDQFRIELFDPQGTPVGPRSDLFSPLPVYTGGPPATCTVTSVDATRLTIPIGLLPAAEIVQGLSHLEVAEQVRARLEPQHHLPTAGLWTVRVSLITAGDCPGSPDAANFQQFFSCRQEDEDGDGADPGNEFTIENVVINTFSVKVEELS